MSLNSFTKNLYYYYLMNITIINTDNKAKSGVLITIGGYNKSRWIKKSFRKSEIVSSLNENF